MTINTKFGFGFFNINGLTDLYYYIKGIKKYNVWMSNYSISIPDMEIIPKLLDKDSIIFDVGANYGEFTFFLSRYIPNGFIYSFEPQKNPFNTLNGLCKKIKNAKPLKIGFSNECSKKTLFIPLIKGTPSPPEASLDPHFNDYSGYAREIKATEYIQEEIQLSTIDKFCNENNIKKLNFLKIDVEGHELEVLKGGENYCLSVLRPIIFIEIFPYVYEDHFITTKNYLENLGFIGYLYEEIDEKLSLLSEMNFETLKNFNFFFIPQEQLIKYDKYLLRKKI